MIRLIAIILAVTAVLAVGIRASSAGGVVLTQEATVEPGEFVEIQLEVYHFVHLFGYRLPVRFTERRTVIGKTVHDYESGKLIGRYHDCDANICPRCNGVGEVRVPAENTKVEKQ